MNSTLEDQYLADIIIIIVVILKVHKKHTDYKNNRPKPTNKAKQGQR